MRVTTVVIIIDLCSNFPLGALNILDTDTPQNSTGLVKVRERYERGRNELILIPTFPLIFNKTLIRVTDAFSALALLTFWRYVAG